MIILPEHSLMGILRPLPTSSASFVLQLYLWPMRLFSPIIAHGASSICTPTSCNLDNAMWHFMAWRTVPSDSHWWYAVQSQSTGTLPSQTNPSLSKLNPAPGADNREMPLSFPNTNSFGFSRTPKIYVKSSSFSGMGLLAIPDPRKDTIRLVDKMKPSQNWHNSRVKSQLVVFSRSFASFDHFLCKKAIGCTAGSTRPLEICQWVLIYM